MLICPACHAQNPDGAVLCERCSSQVSGETIVFEERTIVDPPRFGAPRPVAATPAAGDTLAPGDVVCQRYQILEAIGRGGMGCVYKVIDRHLERVVALKTIRPDLASDPAIVRRFKQEILLARQITHKNVIRIFDFGVDVDLRFITMEYFEGEDLHSRLIREGKLAPQAAVPIMIQICEALASAHAEEVIHRDLKPQNILVNGRNEIRILDFGLARLYEAPAASMVGGLLGTPDYMSPEQARGERVDLRSDLFAAGIVFHEMLTGALPFPGDSVMARLVARTRDRARPLSASDPSLPAALSRIVARCLEREPERRYASATEVLADLRQITSFAAPSQFASTIARLDARAKPLRLGAIVAVILAAMAGATVWFLRPKADAIPSPVEPYVAVLPLSTSGGSTEAKYAADGIRESISSHLFSARDVHAISPGAVDRADLSRSNDEIARKLGANLLLRGEVLEEVGRIRARLALYDVSKHANVWTGSTGGSSTELLSLEDDLARQLFEAMHLTSRMDAAGKAIRPPTGNMEAYDLYLRGRDALKNKRNNEAAAKEALASFEQAVAKDSSFALAWTGIADASVNLYRLNQESIDLERALDAARRASQNSSLPEVHLAAGSVYAQTGKNQQAIAEIQRALQVEPNSDDAYVRLGRVYLHMGQTKAALDALQNAVKLNPYYWYNHEQLARAYFRVGMGDQALTEFQKVAELAPDTASAYLGIGGVYMRQGKWEQSIPEYQRSIARQPSVEAYTSLGTAFFYLGRYSEALPNFQKAAQLNSRDPRALANLGSAYRQLNDNAKADEAFTRAI
ncbi:MAG: protein kinase, partial [Acidobacteriaceae bacterium]|nr:protein kinase [Acidobacteriaceae bacterium]